MTEDDGRELEDSVKEGLRRAGMHWLRAGYEVVAGVEAFLDEVAKARRDGAPDSGDDDPDEPTRIEID